MGVACAACFEQLAGVFASCGAEIDLHSNLSNRRTDWYGLQASQRPYAWTAPVTPNNNEPFISLKINHLQTLRAPQKRHAHCVFCCMTTTYVAQSGTACGHKESRMLQLAGPGSSALRAVLPAAGASIGFSQIFLPKNSGDSKLPTGGNMWSILF